MAEPSVEQALNSNDANALVKAATADELARFKLAEEVLGLARERKKNTSRWALLSSSLVGVVAVAGMLVNAYQSYSARQQQAQQRQVDQERWSKEFVRAQRADKYRAFFETSVLATDPGNPDKRLVGYALLQEFVDDEDYNSKAILMLEESLAQELRAHTEGGLDDAHQNAVVAIVSALSQSSDCHALERAARSIDRVARHHAKEQDAEETAEIFRIYVRRLVGRATLACRTMKDFTAVRRPLVETLLKAPEIAGVTGRLKEPDAHTRIATLLIDECHEELSLTGGTECVSIVQHYAALCAEGKGAGPDEQAACALVKTAATTMPAPPPAPPQP